MIKTIVTAIITYFATSFDEISVLFLLYNKSTNRGKGKTITITYFLGTFLLVALSLLGAFGLVKIPVKWAVGFIGLLPLIMGMKMLIKRDDDEEKAMESANKHQILWVRVLVITIALGADDLGVYIPLFTTLTGWEIVLMLLIFAVGVAVTCFVSYRLTRIDRITSFIEKQERFLIGVIFMAIGILVMLECGTFSVIINLFS